MGDAGGGGRDGLELDTCTSGVSAKVLLLNTDPERAFVVEPGMRIAQLVVLPVPELELVEVDELPESERGVRGFGSSRH